MDNDYAHRRLLRGLERAWSRLEILTNRLTGPDFNPFYHLGTLGIFLLVVLTVTGLYLTFFYRPGAEVAYATVENISSSWIGSLMRSIHRYASDLFLLVVVIHALKTFLSDRFWGARWLAWLTGWLMVILSWAIGTMGYWLIWDVRSQWMTELLINAVGSRVALTFVPETVAASSFAAFVIVLFVHIFLPVALLFLIILHILRLSRARIWSPRWVMVLSLLGLAAVSLLRPAVSESPANLHRFIDTVRLDAWYLGFMPLLDVLGGVNFWLLTGGLLGVSMLLPWLARGRQNGPAVIHASECNGCGLCASECPYRAIEMEYRDDDTSRFKSIAVINTDLCTGCGLCVGTCATLGIELTRMPTEQVYEAGLLAAVRQQTAQEAAPLVVLTCQRQASLGSLPVELNAAAWEPSRAPAGTPVTRGSWPVNGTEVPTITGVLPCVGMADVDWIKGLNRDGAREILLLSCPYDDCNYREGPQWEAARLLRRKGVLAANIHWHEAAPGDPQAFRRMIDAAARPLESREKPVLPDPRARKTLRPRALAAGVLLLFFSALTALALPLDLPARSALSGQAQVRVLLDHSGVIGEALGGGEVELPEGATIELDQILGGRRFPVGLQVWIDGEPVIEEFFEARGARNEGEISGMAVHTLPPGTYALELHINDDGAGWRKVYAGSIELAASQILSFIYDDRAGQFDVIGQP